MDGHIFYFCAHDSYTTKPFSSSTYSGLYTCSEFKREESLSVRKRDWLDAIVFRKRSVTGSKYSDGNLTIRISKNAGWVPSWDDSLTEGYLALASTIEPLKLEIKENTWSFLPDLNSDAILDLETNHWILENNHLDSLIQQGISLLSNLRKLGL